MRLCYVHLPRFPVQRRILEMPSLARRPFVLERESRGQRQVAFASSAALKAGVTPEMPLAAARARLPEIPAFPFQLEAERAALLSLGEALLALAPAFQLSCPDGLWLEGSAAQLCGGEDGWCARVLSACRSHGYRAKVALASQPFTARALARHGGEVRRVVGPREGPTALRGLPLSALEGAEPASDLAALGLSTLGEVAALPPGAVVARMGARGLKAQRLCRGEDDSLFVPAAIPEAVEESMPLDWPAESLEPLFFAIKTCFDRLGARLQGRQRAAVRLTLTLQLESGQVASLTLRLARPSSQPKLLLELARHQLADLTLQSPVAGLQVRVEEACEDLGQQQVLGDEPCGDAGLEGVLSRLFSALGEEALFAAEVLPVHCPERAYAERPFRVSARPEPFGQRRSAAEAPGLALPAFCERPARLFRRPATLEAELDGGGALVSARILGKRRKVTALAGPERLCGEWWQQGGHSRDYYRVFFEGLGPTWIYRDWRDGRFYLQGMFD